jgi:hypothetical protein
MAKQPIISYRQRGFRGLLTSVSQEEVPQGFSPYMQNVSLSKGVLTKATGSALIGEGAAFGESIVALGVMSYEISGIVARYLMRVDADAFGSHVLYRWTGASWVSAMSWVGTFNTMLGLQERFYVAETDKMRMWDPSGMETGVVPDAVGAYSLMSFGDRLVRFFTHNAQSMDWSVDGIAYDFTGVGSGDVQLLDVRGDAVDALMLGVPVGHNNFALFRQTSIMRGFETGNEQLAIGVSHWIDGVGAINRFAACLVDMGVFFIGSDKIAYLLDPGGSLTPVSTPINDQLEISSSLIGARVVYDAKRGEVWIFSIGMELVFDLAHFRSSGQVRWRRENFGMERAYYDNGELYYSKQGYVYKMTSDMTRAGSGFEAIWESPVLNNGEQFRELTTLTLIELTYSSTGNTSIILEAKADNGAWTMPLSGTALPLANTGGGLKTVTAGFNLTGFDLRFRLRFTEASRPEIHSYEPRLVVRGGKEYAS